MWEVRARYGIGNMSVFCAFAFILLLDRMMCAYLWSVRRHVSPPWEDKDIFWGEVRVRYGIKNLSVFCVSVFVLPLARCCCCLWVMGVLALLLHCLLTRTTFFLVPSLGLIFASPPPLLLFSVSLSRKIKT